MMLSEMPAEIQSALAPLATALNAAHLAPVTWQYSAEAFGNFVVTFRSERHAFTLTRDRGQFLFDGADRKSAGLGRVFESAEDLLPHLLSWLRR